MTFPTVLVATWTDGLFVLAGRSQHQEFAGQPVRGLAPDGHGGALAIIDGHSLRRRTGNGEWISLATSDLHLACTVGVGDDVYVGTDDSAHVLRVDATGAVQRLHGFDGVAGRDTWYAGSALVNGRRVGPPLGVRSITAAADAAVLLANVHVGGIPRSSDSGATWHPTIAIECDVHQVCAHPRRPDVVIAAAARGLCVSRDGGVTWTVERAGLHADYCSAVAFVGDDLLVSASADHFAPASAVYRCGIDGPRPLERIGGGLPRWFSGIVDTNGIAASGDTVALTDTGGNVYASTDAGRHWSRLAGGLPPASGVLVL